MLKKHFAMSLLGLGLILAPSFASAQTVSSSQVDECSKEILLSYFPEPFVTPTLKKFNVPQDKWDAIVKGLAEKNKDVLRLVEEKASKLDPNPFKGFDPSQRAAAVKIFRETLTQVFSEVLKANGVTDDAQIAKMLEDIQQQKAANFAKCREKEMQNMQQSGQTPGQMQGGQMQGGQMQKPSGSMQPGSMQPGSIQQPSGSMQNQGPSGYLSDASTPTQKTPYGAPSSTTTTKDQKTDATKDKSAKDTDDDSDHDSDHDEDSDSHDSDSQEQKG